MNKNNLLRVALLAALGLVVFDMSVSHQSVVFAKKKKKKRRRGKSKHGKKGKVSKGRQEAMDKPLLNQSGRASTLKANNSYTIGYILSEIKRNSPKSHFILGATSKGRSVIKGDPVAAGINGSISAARAGLAGAVEENSNMTVTLKSHPALINLLHKKKRLNNATKMPYQQILLYFEFGGHWYYINDPYPGKIVRGRVNPAAQIISRW